MSLKKIKKPNRDNWTPLLVVIRENELAQWKLAAARNGISVMEWVRDRLNRIAPERGA